MEINRALSVRVAEPVSITIKKISTNLNGHDFAEEQRIKEEKFPVTYPFLVHEALYTRNGKLQQVNTTRSYYV